MPKNICKFFNPIKQSFMSLEINILKNLIIKVINFNFNVNKKFYTQCLEKLNIKLNNELNIKLK